jgi:peptidoglycan/xylan/chitin deacetylase (PgdA/CDA1 family)
MKKVAQKVLMQICRSDIFFKRYGNNDVTVFLYHDVSSKPSNFSQRYKLNVDPKIFKMHLELISLHYNIISPIQLKSGIYTSPAALITFDDGFPSYFDEALPILSSFGFPSIIFLNMGPVNGEIFWAGLVTYLCDYSPKFQEHLKRKLSGKSTNNPFLLCSPSVVEEFLATNNRDEIYKMARKFYGEFSTEDHCQKMKSRVGDVYFGNHLYNHYNAIGLSEAELLENIKRNSEYLKQYPNFIDFFSYPFGQPGSCYNLATDKIISKEDFSFVFSAFNLPNKIRGSRFLNRVSLPETVCNLESFRYWVTVPSLLNSTTRRRKYGYY